MIPVIVPSTSTDPKERRKADRRTSRVIETYKGRWVALAPLLMVGLLCGLFMQALSYESQYTGIRHLLVIGLSLFCIVWFLAVWALPTFLYHRLCVKGRILEIRDAATERYILEEYRLIGQRNAELATKDAYARQELLLKIANLDLSKKSDCEVRDTLIGARLTTIYPPYH